MTKLLVSGLLAASLFSAPAFAADLGVISQPAPAGFETHDWTGFYAGVFGGLTTGDFDYTATGLVPGVAVPLLSLNGGGGLAGIQVGTNYQFDQFVVGAVADFALTNHHAEIGFGALGGGGGGGPVASLTSGLSSVATVRARAGYAFDNLLAYVHGGVAYGRSSDDLGIGAIVGAANENPDHFGYTVGAGIEYAVNDTISLQTEYSYTNLGDDVVANGALGGFGSVSQALAFHTVKAGINFSF